MFCRSAFYTNGCTGNGKHVSLADSKLLKIRFSVGNRRKHISADFVPLGFYQYTTRLSMSVYWANETVDFSAVRHKP